MCCRPLLLQGVPWPSPDCPVLFINVDGKEQRTATSGVRRGGEQSEQSSDSEDGSGGGDDGSAAEGGASYCNPAEADVAIRALLRLIERDPDLQSVALLSPYRCAAGMGGSPGLACHCREARRQAVQFGLPAPAPCAAQLWASAPPMHTPNSPGCAAPPPLLPAAAKYACSARW